MSQKPPVTIFFDFETSGLGKMPFETEVSPDNIFFGRSDVDQILSAYFMAVDDRGQVIERMRLEFANRGDVVPKPGAIKTNRIPIIGRRGIAESDGARKIVDFIERHGGKRATLAGHNVVKFDIPIMRQLLINNGYNPRKHLPENVVDTFIEAKREWLGKHKPSHGHVLDNQSPSDGMNLESVCRRLGIRFDKAEAHGARYDVERSLAVWQKLGTPKTSISGAVDNPYDLERKYSGKSLILKNIDYVPKTGNRYSEKKLAVVGVGAFRPDEPDEVLNIQTLMGSKAFAATYVIDEEKIDSGFRNLLIQYTELSHDLIKVNIPELKEMHQNTRAQLSAMLSEKGVLKTAYFEKGASLNGTEVDAESLIPSHSVGGISALGALQEIVTEDFLMPSLLELKAKDDHKKYPLYAKLFETMGVDEGYYPMNPECPVRTGLSVHAPFAAVEWSKYSDGERRDLAIKTFLGERGYGFVGQMLILMEKYGARNNIQGYDQFRRQLLDMQLPEHWPTKQDTVNFLHESRGEDATNRAIFQGLLDRGFSHLDVSCDGKRYRYQFYKLDGQILSGDFEMPKPDSKHEIFSLTGLYKSHTKKHLADSLSELPIGFKMKEANAIADAVLASLVGDVGPSRSYDDYKTALGTALNAELAKPEGLQDQNLIFGLTQSLTVLGQNYDEFIANTKPDIMTPEEHDSLFSAEIVATEDHESEDLLRKLDQQRSDILAETTGEQITLDPVPAPHQPVDMPGQLDYGAIPKTKCKICARDIKSRRSVNGIGPKCAKKLAFFIQNPMVVASGNTSGKTMQEIEKIFDVDDDPRKYPIMLIRHQGVTFVADVLEKRADGQFVMVNLTKAITLAKNQKAKPNPDEPVVKDLCLVFPKISDILVLKIFEDREP